jgi:hypothetical protein
MSFQKDPPVSAEVLKQWQDELDELFPKSEDTSHLKLVWVAGDDWDVLDDGELVWQGVERWYVYEMLPKQFTDPDILFELEHMPEPIVRYDSVMKSVARGDRAVTRLQWRLFKETGMFGKPFWVIQGDRGGHQRFFTTFESQQLILLGLPHNPPLPGTLPYAPYDHRVRAKLLKHDRLRKIGGQLMLLKETQKEKYKRLQKDIETQFRKDIIKFVCDQIGPEEGKDIKRGIRDDAPIQETDYEKLWEQAEANYVETGHFTAY